MREIRFSNFTIKTDNQVFVSGIVDLDVDEKGEYEAKAFALIEDGADLLDLRIMSSKRKLSQVPLSDQIETVVPVIEAVRRKSEVPISVKTNVMIIFQEAFLVGANMLHYDTSMENDIYMSFFCSRYKIPIILDASDYFCKSGTEIEPFDHIYKYFEQRVNYAVRLGIFDKNIIIDPGVCIQNQHFFERINELTKISYPLAITLKEENITAYLDEIVKNLTFLQVYDVKGTINQLQQNKI